MTTPTQAQIEAAQEAYRLAHISGDHFDALRAALTAAMQIGRDTPIEQWPCTYPKCFCGTIKTDCVRTTIERCAQVAKDLLSSNDYYPSDPELGEEIAAAIRKLKDER